MHHDEQAVLCAVEMGLEIRSANHNPCTEHASLAGGWHANQPDVSPPSALALSKEPEANVSRYGGLRHGGAFDILPHEGCTLPGLQGPVRLQLLRQRDQRSLVRQLHRCEFIDAAESVVLIGGSGTGKSHVATALGIQSIEHHRKCVRFFSIVELVNALEQEKALSKSGKSLKRWSRRNS